MLVFRGADSTSALDEFSGTDRWRRPDFNTTV
jgi:hypothetical protein